MTFWEFWTICCKFSLWQSWGHEASASPQLGLLLVLQFTTQHLKKVDSVTQHPSSSHGFSSCSFLPSPQLLPQLPAQWRWWRGLLPSQQHRVGCLRRPEKLPSAAEGPGRSCCGSHQCGGVEHVRSCWRPVEAHSHNSMDCLAEQKKISGKLKIENNF